MFLIRTAFWLGIVVMLLPSDRQQQARFYSAAADVAHQMATFCDRNKTACEQGAVYWAGFQKKLEFGAKVAFDLASERLLGAKGEVASASSTDRLPVEPARNTLTPDDLAPAWRGRHQRAGA